MKRAAVALLVAGACAALAAAPANAGTYAVVSGCGNWSPYNPFTGHMAVYGDCSVLVTRNVWGAFSSVWGVQGYWRFDAPPSTVISGASVSGSIVGRNGWRAEVQANGGVVLDLCPSAGCSGGSKALSVSTTALSATNLFLAVSCLRVEGCSNNGINGKVEATSVVVYVADSTSPSVAVAGGDLVSGWRRLRGTASLTASDNVGIKLDRLLVDGVPREQRARACSWGARVPCPNGSAELSLDTTLLADGPHTLTLQAVDSADNVGSASQAIQVDNTAPAAPAQAALGGDAGWRATNRFAVSWVNPSQAHAPIVATRYQLCPAGSATGCVTASRPGTGIRSIADLAVPAPGAWRLRWWLVDSAGNEDPRAAAETVLRFDNLAPTVVFRDQDFADPARLHVLAQDATSETADVEIEARREGSDSWTSLPTERATREFTAFMDDEALPRGTYQLRARAVDAAGNERTTTSRADGDAAVMTLPVRDAAHLRVGRADRRCRELGQRRRCLTRLDNEVDLDFGQRLMLTGRLRIEGEPSGGPIAVWRQLKLPGEAWSQIATVQAEANGRFRYSVEPGPAQRLRFRFAGTQLSRGATANVDARVRAESTLDVNRRNAVNGEYVTFRGRVKGGHLPSGGKLVELQVFTRRRWRTFALLRADATTGRWTYQYRFETIRGTTRFRFRARVQREAGYPFHTGTSRQVGVVVHGI